MVQFHKLVCALLVATPMCVAQNENAVSGIVLDEAGKPIRNIAVHAEWFRQRRAAAAYSRADGTFRIEKGGYAPESLRIRVMDARGYEPCAPSAKIAWGTRGHKIVLREALKVKVSVVQRDNRKPVLDFALVWSAERHASRLLHKVVRKGRQPGGVVTVDNLWRGDSNLKIVPRDPKLLPSTVRLRVRDGIETVTVQLTRLAPKKILVVDSKGEPISGVRIEVIDPGTMLYQGNAEWVNDERSEWGVACPKPGHRYPSLVHRSVTDGNGQCIAYGIPGLDDHRIRLEVGAEPARWLEDVPFGPKHLSRKIVVPGR